MSSATVSSSQFLAKGRRKWTPVEDAALVSCMSELHTVGHYNADSGFKSGYLPVLERMLAQKLPEFGIKARPHIESRLRTLKRDWTVVYDMINGQHTSGFGWDDTRNMVYAEDDVWEAYVQSHNDAAPFRTKSFKHFDELTLIYAKDRARGNDSQSVQEVLMEAENEDIPYPEEDETEPNHPNADHATSTQNAPPHTTFSGNQESPSTNNSAGKKRKTRNEDAVLKVVTEMHDVGMLLASSMSAPVMVIDGIQEKLSQLDGALRSVDGITREEIGKAHIMFSKNRDLVLVFFGIEPEERLEWLRTMMSAMA